MIHLVMLRNRCIFVYMMIELMCRYPKAQEQDEDLNSQIEAQLKTISIIQGDDYDEKKEREKVLKELGVIPFEYGPFTLDIEDIKSFNLANEQHTCLRFHDGTAYTFLIDYEKFRAIYQTLSGKAINDFSNIILNVEPNQDGEGKSDKND